MAMIGSVFLMPVGNVEADQSGPDSFGYTWTDSNSPDPTVSYNWIDITGTGADAGVYGDDSYAGPFSIGFSFQFYGTAFTQFYVSSNGLVTFGSGTSDWGNDPIPSSSSPNNLIAPYWDDLYVDSYDGGVILYQTVGAAPNQQCVIEFHNVNRLGNSNLMTFEVILNETGEIWAQYNTMSGMTGSGATVGIENSGGTIGTEYSYDTASLSDNLAVMFSLAPVVVLPTTQQAYGYAGGSVSYSLTVMNNQPITDSFDINYTSLSGFPVDLYDGFWNPLVDLNGNSVPDTGNLTPGSSFDIIVVVSIPSSPSAAQDVTTVYAWSYEDPANFGQSDITTNVYSAWFAPPHSDFGLDDDGNTYYDFLCVNASLEVLFPGWFYVYGYLYDDLMTYLGVELQYIWLDAGFSNVTVYFPAHQLYSNGRNCSYEVYLNLYDGAGWYYGYDVHTTSLYNYDEFEGPGIAFAPPHSDSALDTNGDAYYDYLVVDVSVDVTYAGTYSLLSYLYTSGYSYVTDSWNTTYLDVGSRTVPVWFDGADIRQEGFSGSFYVELYLYNESMEYIGYDLHTTASYVYTDFQPMAAFAPPHWDYGEDTSLDGTYDWLVVEVNLTIAQTEYYIVYGDLYDSYSTWIDSVSSGYYYLAEGTHTLELWFDGTLIRENGVDGPYTIYLEVEDDWGTAWDYDVHTTAAYTWDEFQAPPVEFTGSVTDYGNDIDSDMFYEYLIIEFSVNVALQDWYYFELYVYDPSWSWVAYTWNYTELTVGTHTIIAVIQGATLRDYGDNCSYNIDMYVYDDWFTLWDYQSYTTNYYTWDEFGGIAAFVPPHSDFVVDDNGDTLYDYLVLEVFVNVDVADWYWISCSLLDSWSTWIDSYDTYTYLDAGTTAVYLYLSGIEISSNGVDGPYTAELYARDDSWNLLARDTHTTAAYTWDQFQVPGAAFTTPHSDYGFDEDGDSYYDYLVVEVAVDVAIAGDYQVDAWLYDWWGSYVTYCYEYTYLDAGVQTVELYFSGYDIWQYYADGPYDVEMELYDSADNYLDYDLYTTSSYTWDEFEPQAVFLPPHSDYGQDDNDDALYDYLVIEVVVDVEVAEWYWVYGGLYDSTDTWMDDYYYNGYFDTGTTTIELYFEGLMISDHGVDGPYTVYLELYTDSWDYLDSDTHDTAAYAWNEFQMPGAAFWPPYADYALDMNGDSYYDYLMIELQINVSIAGWYEIDCLLYSPTWSYLGYRTVQEYYSVGVHVVEVAFSGRLIYGTGQVGQFHAEADLYYLAGSWLDYASHTTASYSYDEFSPPGASLGSPHSDYAIDANDDMLYDYLVVAVTVEVDIAGTYWVEGWLYDWWGSTVDYDYNWTYLNVGTQTVELYFSGWEIRSNMEDGPFDVELALYDEYWYYLDSDWYTTASYLWNEFQTAPAAFEMPFSDYGLDTNGDTLYDYLVVGVVVNVTIAGYFYVEGSLYDYWWDYITYADAYVYLDEGVHTVELRFDGWEIREGYYDGQYHVETDLYGSDDSWLDSATHTTDVWYTYDQFQTFPAVFDPPHDDYGLSTAGDALFEFLVVEVFLDVAVAGSYIVSGDLYDTTMYGYIDSAVVQVDLDAGLRQVELRFEGWAILASGMDGPFDVDLDLYVDDWVWLDYDSHTTDAYDYDEFDGEIPSMRSYWTATPPAIDGVFSPDEWADALPVSLRVADPANELDALLLVLNNGTHLFICYDATGDLTEDSDDCAAVAFDTGNDGTLTHLHEDQFCIGGTGWFPNGQAHYVYDFAMDNWVVHCSPLNDSLTDHDGLSAARGFGGSDSLASDHRVYEFSIPLDLLGLAPGDIAGFVGGSESAPAVFDASQEVYSTWPMFLTNLPSPRLFGDLILSSSAPPTTTADVTGTMGGGGWYVSNVQVTLTADDAEEGIDYTMYRLDGGSWQTYTAAVVVSAGGTHALDYYSVDLGGNVEITQTVTFRIDTVAPTTTATLTGTEGENGWHVSSVSLRLSATDASGGSGVEETVYRTGGGAWTTYTGTALVFAENGTYTVEFYSEDVASNDESVKSVTFMIDVELPVTTPTVDGAKVTLDAVDEVSGINSTMYRIDGGDWILYTGEITVEGKGNHTVEFYSVDEAGNVEAIQMVLVDVPSGGILGSASWLWILIVIVAAAAAVSLFVIFGMKRKGRGQAPQVGYEQAPPDQVIGPEEQGGSPYDEALTEDEGVPPPPA